MDNYKAFAERCESHLNTKDEYKKDEFEMELKELYLEKGYNFSLKPSTISTIISNWKKKSTKFTKYSSIDNPINKHEEIILWKYENFLIYTKDKSKSIRSEFFMES